MIVQRDLLQCNYVDLPCANGADVFAQAGEILSFKNRFGGMFVRLELFSCGVGEEVHVKPVRFVEVPFSIVPVVVVSGGGGRDVSAVFGVRSWLVLDSMLS